MKTKENQMFLVQQLIDIQNTPGDVINNVDGVFSSRESADARCEQLQSELDEELRGDDEDGEEEECEEYDGYDVSGPPVWVVSSVTVK